MKPFSDMHTTTWQEELPSRTIGRWDLRKQGSPERGRFGTEIREAIDAGESLTADDEACQPRNSAQVKPGKAEIKNSRRWAENRNRYIKPQGTPHAWNNTLKGSYANETNSETGLGDTRGPHAAPADRFSTAPGKLRHLMKDGVWL